MASTDGPPETGMPALLDRIRPLPDRAAVDALFGELARPARPVVLSFLNQHAFNLAWSDPIVRSELAGADVLLRDGVGVEIALRRLGRPVGLNANGTDLIPALFGHLPPRRVAVFGTREPWLTPAAERIAAFGHAVVAVSDGFRTDAQYLELCRRTMPDAILLGMGMPRQERLAARLAAELDRPCLVVNGGAVLDFLAERFPRAPLWMRRARLEWLFRFVQEPGRLAERYLVGGLRFARRVRVLERGLSR